MPDAWIEVKDLRLSRGGRPVLQGMDVALAGRAVGLVGANGAGKSTLIGALLGVLRPEMGRVRVMELDIPLQARALRARCGVMAEQAGVFPGGSGVEAVRFAGMLSGLSPREALRRAHRTLDALAVGEERYRPTRGYSTGMRQRCKLAMSLVHDPELLILDEPTVGLDPPGRAQLLELIRELRDQGRRILLSTHILHDAAEVCDELLIIEAGMVSYSGPLGALLDAGGNHLLAEGRGLDEAFATALTAAGLRVLTATESRIEFVVDGDEDLRIFWGLAAERGGEVRALRREAESLEDAVLQRMGGAHD